MAAAVSIRGLSKVFRDSNGRDVSVFERLDVEFEQGTITSVVGPSGCGKTTLLNVIAELEAPDAGEIRVDASSGSRGQRSIGYMFQTNRLMPWRTAMRNALMGLEITGRGGAEAIGPVSEMLRRFGLDGFEDSYPSELSEGMAQRVALARALAIRPKVLLLDEPFSSVDFNSKLVLENEILRFVSQSGATAIFVSHDYEEAIVLGARVIILTARPAKVHDVIEVPIPIRSREALAVRQMAEFPEQLAKLSSIMARASRDPGRKN